MNSPSTDITEATLKRLNSHNWAGRLLTSAALALGFLAIAAGVLLAVANANRVMPMERLLIWKYPGAAAGLGITVPSDSPDSKALTRDELDARHVEVTFMHGKELFLTMSAVALVGIGAFLTLLLVLLNRRVTLRQVNASLAQISHQIQEMQQRSPKA
jgi:hypothetical protein